MFITKYNSRISQLMKLVNINDSWESLYTEPNWLYREHMPEANSSSTERSIPPARIDLPLAMLYLGSITPFVSIHC